MHASLVGIVVTVLLAVGGRSMAASPPTLCADGRFIVQGNPLLGFGADGSDAVTLATSQVSIATGCAFTPARRVKATRKGTKIVVTWKLGCGIWRGPIKLTALIEPLECNRMTGIFKHRNFDGRMEKRGFIADRQLDGTCQDGGIEAWPLIQSRIFYARGCNVSTCHGPYAQANLDLSQEAAYLNLVNVAANNATANAAGKLRVLPGDAANSFLSQKLHGTQAAGEGSRMPLIASQLPADELALIDTWIAAGAPQTGRVPDQPCLPPNAYVPTEAPPVPPGGYQILLEGPWLQPGQEQEGCMWVKVPNTADFTAGKWEFALNPGTHHFAIFPWTKSGIPSTTNTWTANDIGCISGSDFGNTLSGAPQAPYFVATYPAGIGRVIEGGSYIGLNAHYRNYWQVPIQIKIWSNVYPYAGTPTHLGQTIIDYTDMFSINVPVNTQKIQPGRWLNDSGQTRDVYSVTGHMHKRGLRFTAKKSDGTIIYENFDFAHPIFREFDPPLVLAPGDWIDYECLHDNGVTRPVRRDGFGNPIPLVFGVTTDDEMCTLNGEFYTN
jgi:hypothetical protein